VKKTASRCSSVATSDLDQMEGLHGSGLENLVKKKELFAVVVVVAVDTNTKYAQQHNNTLLPHVMRSWCCCCCITCRIDILFEA